MNAIARHDFDYIRELVRQRSAIVLEAGKEYLVESRLQTVAFQSGCSSLQELVTRLRAQPFNALHQQVIEALTTNETSFFRDLHPFEALRTTVLPALLEKRLVESRLTIWCAAASTGQEPYSIAILLREHFPQLARWNLRILASDLNTEVLEKARQGRYSQIEVNRGLPAPLLVRYFEKKGIEWQLKDSIRQMVEFRCFNLAAPWPLLPPVDILFLRNVLIYFDQETKKDILVRTRKVLRPDGVLFLGGAETTLNVDEGFERVAVDRTGYYRIRSAAAPSSSLRAA